MIEISAISVWKKADRSKQRGVISFPIVSRGFDPQNRPFLRAHATAPGLPKAFFGPRLSKSNSAEKKTLLKKCQNQNVKI